MKVLGVDPGTAVLGYGIVEGAPGRPGRLVECGVIRTRPREPLALRLRVLYEGLTEVIAHHQPDVMAVETVFYQKNVKTTVTLGHARGVILLTAALGGIETFEYSPATVKKTIVGRGGALKPQVGFMVAKLLQLRSAPAPADAADGVAVALTHLLRAADPRRRRLP